MNGSETSIDDVEADSADGMWANAVSNPVAQFGGSDCLNYIFTPPGSPTPTALWSHTQGIVSSGLEAVPLKLQKVAEAPLIS